MNGVEITAIVICILLQAVMIYLLVRHYKRNKIFRKRCKNCEELYRNRIRNEIFYQDESFIVKDNKVISVIYNVYEKDILTVSTNTERIGLHKMLSLITDNTKNLKLFGIYYYFDLDGDYYCDIILDKPCVLELSATLLKATESLQKNGASLTE